MALGGEGTRSVLKARRTLPGLSPCPRGEIGQGSRVLVLFASDGAQTGAWHREGT